MFFFCLLFEKDEVKKSKGEQQRLRRLRQRNEKSRRSSPDRTTETRDQAQTGRVVLICSPAAQPDTTDRFHESTAPVQPSSPSTDQPQSSVPWKEPYNPAATWRPSTERNSPAAAVEAEESSRFLNLEVIHKERREFQVEKENREREAIVRQEQSERLERVEYEKRKRDEDHRRWVENDCQRLLREQLSYQQRVADRAELKKKQEEAIKNRERGKELERRQAARHSRREEERKEKISRRDRQIRNVQDERRATLRRRQEQNRKERREEDIAADKKKDLAASVAVSESQKRRIRTKRRIADLFGSDSDQDRPVENQRDQKRRSTSPSRPRLLAICFHPNEEEAEEPNDHETTGNQPKSFDDQVAQRLKKFLNPPDRPLDAENIVETLIAAAAEEDDDVLQLDF